MNELAPIVLFLYNRPEHSKRTLDALALNPEAKDSLLFIYCDGVKANATKEQFEKIEQVKLIAASENRFKQVKVVSQTINQGLAKSVTQGVTEIVNKYEKIIVVEDDLVVAPHFLSFMNEALNLYESKIEVACISGYVYPVKKTLPETFFIRIAECWGWATWKRGWSLFEIDGKKLLTELKTKNLTSKFDFENSYNFTQMLIDQIEHKNNSWAILWYASVFLKENYCLYPGKSLVKNIGNDGTGTHSNQATPQWDVNLSKYKITVSEIEVKEDIEARKSFSNHFKNHTNTNYPLLTLAINKTKTIIKKLTN